MPLRPSPLLLALVLICGALAPGVRADEVEERFAAAHLLASGALPGPTTSLSRAATLAEQLEAHRAALQADAPARASVVQRAWRDAYGRPPAATELDIPAPAGAWTYCALLAHHVATLRTDAAARTAVVHRAYRAVVSRDAYPEELAYWQRYDALPFVLLVGCVEDWAVRNQPGLMSTTGVPTISPNSVHLATLRVSPAVAAEVRAALGLAPSNPPFVPRLLAVGGAQIGTRAGMHLLVVGREPLRPAAR